ncbi:hypothetical protein GCM10010873_32140 [Cypionkella aquatica]|uniref:DUF1330 domain-containing protein n=1 Tax=Cypionkella aquatica TaxID=1756042 RepID=A0AA37U7I9_9RHOB|nr:DUF1330 domain-containing protein [Cypionkella aquatica]GLS88240.1 hypothetical protein GCM10010873_32140 [Cypionkella aquatica]
MPAYWIAHVTVTDPAQYSGYQALAPLAFAKFGAKFLARGGASDSPEGAGFERHVLIEFPDLQAARACYASAEYQAARAARTGAAEVMITMVEGV